MKLSESDCDGATFAQQDAQQVAQYEAQEFGRLEAGTWADVTPLPFPSIFDRPVSPSKLDPVLLKAGPKGVVHAHREGWL